MVSSAQFCHGSEECTVNTQMRHVHTSATERDGIQERFPCSNQVGRSRFVDETGRATEQKHTNNTTPQKLKFANNQLAKSPSSDQPLVVK